MKLMLLVVVTVLAMLRGGGETEVLLMRHAEREASGRDPGLTPAGRARAEALAQVAKRLGVEVVFVTAYRRTQETAGPTAAALGLTPVVASMGASAEAHADGVAREILSEWKGKRVLVVGHSNTVPLIIRALGVEERVVIEESAYGDAFMVRVGAGGGARLERLHVGE